MSLHLHQQSLSFVLKDNMLVFICPHTYQLLYDLSSVILKVLENEVSMSAERHIPHENKRFHLQAVQTPRHHKWLKLKPSHSNNMEIQPFTSLFLLHQQMNFFPHNSSAVSNYGVFMRERMEGKWKLSLPLCCWSTWRIGFLKTPTAKMASPSLWVRQSALHELPVSVSHWYRVSPAQPHTGSESLLFTSCLQAADSSSPRVTSNGRAKLASETLISCNSII